uniref:Uncharacterized protein n=1 Tax=Chromera velia CCMP2878 TaxID=1169474 RepID=A0A0G4HAG2_9ALVE|eukprot:Cvel_905.t1-p1 / transcript=Cvel_905.t1 / gene=Cvel_905 / organism=Chromera_velia_CCMP2878 / gene_product=hypothetical protein / transcript_product=hypothetical protein / location=Cvel_scaffold28:161733-168188(-) / protein_length=1506 / sequence_SO=supercontig / SO=protein_coding / is_pseudo=false
MFSPVKARDPLLQDPGGFSPPPSPTEFPASSSSSACVRSDFEREHDDSPSLSVSLEVKEGEGEGYKEGGSGGERAERDPEQNGTWVPSSSSSSVPSSFPSPKANGTSSNVVKEREKERHSKGRGSNPTANGSSPLNKNSNSLAREVEKTRSLLEKIQRERVKVNSQLVRSLHPEVQTYRMTSEVGSVSGVGEGECLDGENEEDRVEREVMGSLQRMISSLPRSSVSSAAFSGGGLSDGGWVGDGDFEGESQTQVAALTGVCLEDSRALGGDLTLHCSFSSSSSSSSEGPFEGSFVEGREEGKELRESVASVASSSLSAPLFQQNFSVLPLIGGTCSSALPSASGVPPGTVGERVGVLGEAKHGAGDKGKEKERDKEASKKSARGETHTESVIPEKQKEVREENEEVKPALPSSSVLSGAECDGSLILPATAPSVPDRATLERPSSSSSSSYSAQIDNAPAAAAGSGSTEDNSREAERGQERRGNSSRCVPAGPLSFLDSFEPSSSSSSALSSSSSFSFGGIGGGLKRADLARDLALNASIGHPSDVTVFRGLRGCFAELHDVVHRDADGQPLPGALNPAARLSLSLSASASVSGVSSSAKSSAPSPAAAGLEETSRQEREAQLRTRPLAASVCLPPGGGPSIRVGGLGGASQSLLRGAVGGKGKETVEVQPLPAPPGIGDVASIVDNLQRRIPCESIFVFVGVGVGGAVPFPRTFVDCDSSSSHQQEHSNPPLSGESSDRKSSSEPPCMAWLNADRQGKLVPSSEKAGLFRVFGPGVSRIRRIIDSQRRGGVCVDPIEEEGPSQKGEGGGQGGQEVALEYYGDPVEVAVGERLGWLWRKQSKGLRAGTRTPGSWPLKETLSQMLWGRRGRGNAPRDAYALPRPFHPDRLICLIDPDNLWTADPLRASVKIGPAFTGRPDQMFPLFAFHQRRRRRRHFFCVSRSVGRTSAGSAGGASTSASSSTSIGLHGAGQQQLEKEGGEDDAEKGVREVDHETEFSNLLRCGERGGTSSSPPMQTRPPTSPTGFAPHSRLALPSLTQGAVSPPSSVFVSPREEEDATVCRSICSSDRERGAVVESEENTSDFSPAIQLNETEVEMERLESATSSLSVPHTVAGCPSTPEKSGAATHRLSSRQTRQPLGARYRSRLSFSFSTPPGRTVEAIQAARQKLRSPPPPQACQGSARERDRERGVSLSLFESSAPSSPTASSIGNTVVQGPQWAYVSSSSGAGGGVHTRPETRSWTGPGTGEEVQQSIGEGIDRASTSSATTTLQLPLGGGDGGERDGASGPYKRERDGNRVRGHSSSSNRLLRGKEKDRERVDRPSEVNVNSSSSSRVPSQGGERERERDRERCRPPSSSRSASLLSDDFLSEASSEYSVHVPPVPPVRPSPPVPVCVLPAQQSASSALSLVVVDEEALWSLRSKGKGKEIETGKTKEKSLLQLKEQQGEGNEKSSPSPESAASETLRKDSCEGGGLGEQICSPREASLSPSLENCWFCLVPVEAFKLT